MTASESAWTTKLPISTGWMPGGGIERAVQFSTPMPTKIAPCACAETAIAGVITIPIGAWNEEDANSNANRRSTRARVFHHFPDKRAFGYALVDETIASMIRAQWFDTLAVSTDPLTTIGDAFEAGVNVLEAAPLNGCVIRTGETPEQRTQGSL